ncbi:MarR family transcriptional regulator [Rhodobacter sp. SGA-6-6]|uniref:MarR family winged helix-turn-helix transcriptional regulator n=1 Tax=Rhodobacter sp. SGA-6-6 TaxID=2710882 RepID=UPI0013EAFDDF|nr:MarR family transcriptional regulator [Rhodobacter sp. SGA-6-6]NGM46222.1 MarR family transcriptional regulator [Rhodobacter sp. SGA-6-6]
MSAAAENIAHAMSRLALYWRAAGWRAAGAQGLTPTQAEILSQLAAGPLRSGDLARGLGVSAPTLTDAVSTLAAKGLVERRPDPQDRRAARVALTPQGAGAEARLPDMPEAIAPVLDGLSEPDRAGLLRGLTLVIRGLQEAGAIPVQRMCLTCRHFRPHAHDDAARPHHCAFVDAAFGDAALRLACADHGEAAEEERALALARFAAVA